MKNYSSKLIWLGFAAALLPLDSLAQLTIQEDFVGTKLQNPWIAIGGACLTASTAYSTSNAPTGTIPGCVTTSGGPNLNYSTINGGSSSQLVGGYTGSPLPDANNYGALRLTNGANSSMASTNGNNETGAIIGAKAFPSSQGLHITFNTVTWGGNAYNNGQAKSGADGINFFLLDASQFSTDSNDYYVVTKTGSFGGALGYDCSPGKSPADGFVGGFLGLGIDEYGNYGNSGDNGNASDPLSPGFLPNAISIRGPGNVTATATYKNIAGPITSVANICKYGYYTTSATPSSSTTTGPISGTPPATSYVANYTNNTTTETSYKVLTTGSHATYSQTTAVYSMTPVLDYPLLAAPTKLAAGNPIYGQEYVATPQRQSATPISYTVDLTSTGLLSISYSYNGGVSTPVINNQNVLNTSFGSTGMPTYFLFGFAAGTGGGSNNHEITCFKAAQFSETASSVSSNIPQNAQIENLSGEQIYVASYDDTYWSGSVSAKQLYYNTTTGVVGVGNVDATTGQLKNTNATWDASCVLTGNVCANTGGTTATPLQAYTARAIATWGGAKGVPFNSNSISGFPAAVQTALNASQGSTPDNYAQYRVNYIRGDRSQESAATATVSPLFRTRRSVLGDVINSSPVGVGVPNGPYPQTGSWIDLVTGATAPEGATYANFVSTYGSRLNVAVVGANDGMLHAFSAGTWTNGTFDFTNDTGVELFAYVPSVALNTLHSTYDIGEYDFTSIGYAHNAYVDASPAYGDLYYGGGWHTWVLGATGDGGNATGVVNNPSGTAIGDIFAIDLTNLTTTSATTTLTSTKTSLDDATVALAVMGDWNSNTITCDVPVASCGKYLGSTYGPPVIKRMHSGNWAIIFGNGMNSANGTAGIFVGEISGGSSSTPPTVTFHYYDTGAGPVSDPANPDKTNPTVKLNPAANGISNVTTADLDGDNIVDYIYAGDAVGNLWRFDVTEANSSQWGTAFKLFNASNASSTPGLQPITAKVAVSAIYYQSQPRLIINFGTGRQYPQNINGAANYAPAAQSLYGIWDWNMDAWNKLNSTQYVSISASSPPGTITLSSLTYQKLSLLTGLDATNTGTTQGATDTNNPVCFQGITGCTGTSPSYGWYAPLPNSDEQIIFNPTVNEGLLFVNSVIPYVSNPFTCAIKNASGYTYAVSASTGGGAINVFNDAAGASTTTPVVGLGLNGVGTPIFATAIINADPAVPGSGTTVSTMITNGLNGPESIKYQPGTGGSNQSSRLTWLQIR